MDNRERQQGGRLAAAGSETARQFARYLVVGVMNTLVTLGVIFVLKSVAGVNPWVSNAAGYVAGVINSFIWNRRWVFRSGGAIGRQAAAFAIGFGVCYALQFGVTWTLVNCTPLHTLLIPLPGFTLSGYGVATLAGMVVYTVANYCYNRLIAFR